MTRHPASANRPSQPSREGSRRRRLTAGLTAGAILLSGSAAAEAKPVTLKAKEVAAAHRVEQRIVRGQLQACDPNVTVFWTTPGSQHTVTYQTNRPLKTKVNGTMRYVGLDQQGETLATIKARILPRTVTVVPNNDSGAYATAPGVPQPHESPRSTNTNCQVEIGPHSGPRHLPVAQLDFVNPQSGQETVAPALIGFTTQTPTAHQVAVA